MSKYKKQKNLKNHSPRGKETIDQLFPFDEIKRFILAISFCLIAVIIAFSFFGLAGTAGKLLIEFFSFLFGKATFIIPFVFLVGGIVFLITKYKKFLWPVILAILCLILALSGILNTLNNSDKLGGVVGFVLTWPLIKLFGVIITQILFGAVIIVGILILWQLSFQGRKIPSKHFPPKEEASPSPSLIKKIFLPKFKVKEIESVQKPSVVSLPQELKPKLLEKEEKVFSYQPPPFDLLESDKGTPNSGDIRTNSAIIKKTLENFGILVEMAEVNVGPTVTQYTFKPAEGIKLSKITALANDLALALASHPIRIEAPIPGKSLVGIEIPNKTRIQVRLKELISNSQFQNSVNNLMFALGRDVSGSPVYGDLAKMPHLLVAGSTGAGKTIFLNSLILSLLYRNSPEILRLILIDPKRVEFPFYNELPHLLVSVIHEPVKTVNALSWLIQEMERRFELFAAAKARDILTYNQTVDNSQIIPFILLIIDELADLMAAKGREIEARIIRLAQMARAVGIHLVLATQRPSVEVITGLIKANITSRVAFQVASQVDSRTILDLAGAEKLLGAGDMLYFSSETSKPKRIQGSYVSEKEVKKVVSYLKSKFDKMRIYDQFSLDFEREIEIQEEELGELSSDQDSLYEEAKKVVVEAKKASASLLQRRLRIGYARAARLLDVLEEKGIVGPSEGAKPREVLIKTSEDKRDWQKI